MPSGDLSDLIFPVEGTRGPLWPVLFYEYPGERQWGLAR